MVLRLLPVFWTSVIYWFVRNPWNHDVLFLAVGPIWCAGQVLCDLSRGGIQGGPTGGDTGGDTGGPYRGTHGSLLHPCSL